LHSVERLIASCGGNPKFSLSAFCCSDDVNPADVDIPHDAEYAPFGLTDKPVWLPYSDWTTTAAGGG
jgi:hypothetical protein